MIDLEAMRARNNNRREYEGPGDWCEEYSASCAVDDIDVLLAEIAERNELDAIVDRCVESFSVRLAENVENA